MRWEPGMTLGEMETQAIRDAMRFHEGNKTQTARALGISERTLYDKLKAIEVIDYNQRMGKVEDTETRRLWLDRQRGKPNTYPGEDEKENKTEVKEIESGFKEDDPNNEKYEPLPNMKRSRAK